MKTPPTPSFKMTQPEFLFEFLIVPFDDPAMLGQVHQFPETGVSRNRGAVSVRRTALPGARPRR